MSWLALALLSVALGGCMGGTIGQQLARSLLLHGADKITSNAYDAQQRKEAESRRNVVLKDTVPDEYWAAFVTSSFPTITPTVEQLPQNDSDNKAASLQATRLVRVEMWNLLVGDEKLSVLEKGRLLGASDVPPQSEWKHWQVATGAIDGDKKDSSKNNQITFLIPPDFGKISSGERAFVELAGGSDFSVARYPAR
ncbi:MAG TPA: hypothetical protein VIE91_02325 [Methylophilaceae bacterium]